MSQPIVIQQCPSCAGPLEVRELFCPQCELRLHGRFESPVTRGPFAELTSEQQAFLRLFVRCRGNLSELERTLGVSYPTVRGKLDELVQALDLEVAQEGNSAKGTVQPRVTRHEVLARIAAGELSAAEGMTFLRHLL